MTTQLNSRYEINDVIGSGGMGAVYRAFDRLKRRTVALKRLHVAPDLLEFSSMASSSNILLSLANEFQTQISRQLAYKQ